MIYALLFLGLCGLGGYIIYDKFYDKGPRIDNSVDREELKAIIKNAKIFVKDSVYYRIIINDNASLSLGHFPKRIDVEEKKETTEHGRIFKEYILIKSIYDTEIFDLVQSKHKELKTQDEKDTYNKLIKGSYEN